MSTVLETKTTLGKSIHQDRIARFFVTRFNRPDDQSRKDRILHSVITNRPVMSSTTRAIIAIPVHADEGSVSQVLSLYQNQVRTFPETFEVVLLVNELTHTGVRGIDRSTAYHDAVNFMHAHPELPLTIGKWIYDRDEIRIGTVRVDTAAIALARIAQANLDPRNIIMITNDADALVLPSEFPNALVRMFDSNPRLGIVVGHADYSQEDFARIPILYAIKRTQDLVELLDRHKGMRSHIVAKAGNFAIRLDVYMDAGGHRDYKAAESAHFINYASQVRGIDIMHHRHQQALITSARRAIRALSSDKRVAHVYKEFGRRIDLTGTPYTKTSF